MEAYDLQIIGQTIAETLTFSSGAEIAMFDTDTALTANSNTRVATQAALKSYVDSKTDLSIADTKIEVVDVGSGQIVATVDSATVMTITDGQVTITGDLAVDGTTFVVNNQEITTADNIIVLNNGEIGAGVTAGTAGIEIDRGSETDYQFIFNETSDTFRIGEIGSLQAVATREDSPNDVHYPYWNNISKSFDTSSSKVVNSGDALYLYHSSYPVLSTYSSIGNQQGGVGIHSTTFTDFTSLWHDSDNNLFYVYTRSADTPIYLSGVDSVDGFRTMARFTPGGSCALIHDNQTSIATAANGMYLYNSTGTLYAGILNTSSETVLSSYIHGEPIRLQAENNSGVVANLLVADPDAGVTLFYANSSKLVTTSTGATVTGTLVADSVTVSNALGLAWENGVNRITHNDGGGNVQIRFGHDYTSSDERFTHAGTAFYIGGNMDSAAGTLTLKVASNGGAGNDEPVTWGSGLILAPTTLTFAGTITATKVEGAVWG